MTKRAAIYSRVSTDKQTTENQERELREIAERSGCRLSRLTAKRPSRERRGATVDPPSIPCSTGFAKPGCRSDGASPFWQIVLQKELSLSLQGPLSYIRRTSKS